jgi:hypothetical protein
VKYTKDASLKRCMFIIPFELKRFFIGFAQYPYRLGWSRHELSAKAGRRTPRSSSG